MEGKLLSFYLSKTSSERSLCDVVKDILRIGSASADIDDVREKFAECLDAETLQEFDQNFLFPIKKTLSDLSIQCEEVKTKVFNATSFFAPKMRPRDALKRLWECWTTIVPLRSVNGLVGRAFAGELEEMISLFRHNLIEEDIIQLAAADASRLSAFLSTDAMPFLPSATT